MVLIKHTSTIMAAIIAIFVGYVLVLGVDGSGVCDVKCAQCMLKCAGGICNEKLGVNTDCSCADQKSHCVSRCEDACQAPQDSHASCMSITCSTKDDKQPSDQCGSCQLGCGYIWNVPSPAPLPLSCPLQCLCTYPCCASDSCCSDYPYKEKNCDCCNPNAPDGRCSCCACSGPEGSYCAGDGSYRLPGDVTVYWASSTDKQVRLGQRWRNVSKASITV